MIFGLVLLISFLYSSIGFGGGSGYLIVMAWFNIPVNFAVTSALLLNLFVSGISFFNYYKGGFFRPKLLLPFVFSSIPAAFISARIRIDQFDYLLLLHIVLFVVSLRMFFSQEPKVERGEYKLPSVFVMLISGAILGFLAGVLGIGGGIFLSPLIILSKWGSPKQASAISAGFVWLNSFAGLIGRIPVGSLVVNSFTLSLIPVGILGSFIGSKLGANYFSGGILKRILSGIILLAVIKFVYENFEFIF